MKRKPQVKPIKPVKPITTCPICGKNVLPGFERMNATYIPDYNWWLLEHLKLEVDGEWGQSCARAGYQVYFHGVDLTTSPPQLMKLQ